MKTLKEFRECDLDFYEYFGAKYNQTIITEVDEDVFEEFLNVLMPSYMSSFPGDGFMYQMCEPSSFEYNQKKEIGGNTHSTFIKINKRFFFLGDHFDLNDPICDDIGFKEINRQITKVKQLIKENKEVVEEPRNLSELLK